MKTIVAVVVAALCSARTMAESALFIDGAKQVLTDGVYQLTDDEEIDSLVITNATLDLNGHNCTVKDATVIVDTDSTTTIVNSSSTDVTFTARPWTNRVSVYQGRMSGNFVFRKDTFSGTNNNVQIESSYLGNKGIVVEDGTLSVGCDSVECNMIRFTPSRNKGGRPGYDAEWNYNQGWHAQEFYLIRDGENIPWPTGTTVAPSTDLKNWGNTLANIIDNDKETRCWVGLNMGVVITFPKPLSFDSYSFMTGPDGRWRDPLVWTLEASSDGGETWVKIGEENGFATTSISNTIVNTKAKTQVVPPFQIRRGSGVNFAEAYELTIGANAALEIANLNSDLNGTRKLAGAGTLVLKDKIWGSVSTGAGFTGSIFATGDVEDDLSGVTKLAITHGAMTILNTNNTYSGETRVAEQGALTASGSCCARYFRFSVQKSTGCVYIRPDGVYAQLSEIELRQRGEKVPWPQGTLAVREKGNVAMPRFVDNTVDTLHHGWDFRKDHEGPNIIITLPYPMVFDGYGLYTGADSILGSRFQDARHPVSWTFEYSSDGVNWTKFNQQVDNWNIVHWKSGAVFDLSTVTNNLAIVTNSQTQGYIDLWAYRSTRFYTYDAPAMKVNTLSPFSELNADGGLCRIETAAETVKSLAGSSALTLGESTRFTVNPGVGEVFGGSMDNGVFVKAGEGRQVLSGAMSCKAIVIEGGELELAGATLVGGMNIVLKGGSLSGTATAQGDLSVTAAGGIYDAKITGVSKLTVSCTDDNKFLIKNNAVSEPIRKTLFGFAELVGETPHVLDSAELDPDCGAGWRFSLRKTGTTFGYSLVKSGMVIIIR